MHMSYSPPREGCPVNGLPTELLARIFYLGTHLVHNPPAPLPVPFPVLTSHVSRRWRSIALGSPSLWTTISFSKGVPYECSQTWIKRSKRLPIEITMELWISSRGAATGRPLLASHVSTILNIIVPHVARWRKLVVAFDQDVHLGTILTRLAQCAGAPLLEILELQYLSNINPDSPRLPLGPFHCNTPRLSYVTLGDVSIGWSSSLLHDLVGLELQNQKMNVRPSWAEFSRILRESPRLTNLELFNSGPAEPFTDWQDEPIELPSLENLSLACLDPIYLSSLFRRLSIPSLKKLSLHLSNGDCSELVRQLTSSPRSVLSGLQYLKINNWSSDSNTIKPMYEQLTNLKSIFLNCQVDKSSFTTLMESFSGTLYCPNLTTIITSGISGRKMRSFIAVRAFAGIPIKRIAMKKYDSLSKKDEKWLKDKVQVFERFSRENDV